MARAVARTYVEKIRWTPHLEGYALQFEARVTGDPADDLAIEVVLRHGERLLAKDRYLVVNREVDRMIVLSDPGIDDFRNELLWSPERPTLLDAKVRLLQNGEVIDEFESYTALRSVHILRDRFMLNSRPYMLRMVLDQGYWPDTLLAAPSDDALRKDVELAKAMGFNGVRKHQKIEDPRYLYWADKLGLLVWEEMPSAYRFTRTAIKRTVREWSEAIERDYSHPCVVRLGAVQRVVGRARLDRQALAAARGRGALSPDRETLDSTRPVIGNDGWESSATDIIGIHDYDANTEHIRQRYGPEIKPEQLFDRRRPGGRMLTLDGYPHRGQPIMLTEFGGIAFSNGAKSNGTTNVGLHDRQHRSRVHRALSAAAAHGDPHGAVQRFLLHAVRRHVPGGQRPAVRRPHAEDSAGADRGGDVGFADACPRRSSSASCGAHKARRTIA